MLQLRLNWIQTWTKLGSLSVRQQPAGCQTRSRRVDETQGWERDFSRFMVCTYFFLLKSPAFWKNQERPWEDYFNEWFIPVFIVIAFSALSIRKCFDILTAKSDMLSNLTLIQTQFDFTSDIPRSTSMHRIHRCSLDLPADEPGHMGQREPQVKSCQGAVGHPFQRHHWRELQ